jgi:hypothetical protein
MNASEMRCGWSAALIMRVHEARSAPFTPLASPGGGSGGKVESPKGRVP